MYTDNMYVISVRVRGSSPHRDGETALPANAFLPVCLQELPNLPASLAHFRMDVTSLPFWVLQIPLRAAALTPMVFRLVFTPHRNAVAVAALSGIWKSTL